jgi:hypothetical protein
MDLIMGVPNEKKLLVGNKLDLGQGVSCEEVQELADEFGIDFILVSSKTGENFDTLIDRLGTIISEP